MVIQHSDRNISPAAYTAWPGKLLVTSIFYTLQGEGPYAGCPAVFVRLAGCNRGRKEDMGCAFCDTKFHFDNGKAMTYQEITDEISRLLDGKVAITVITGGEPMIQDNLTDFIKHHRSAFPSRSVQIESNGDRLAKGIDELKGYCQIVVSPKVNKDGYHKLKPEVLAATLCLKFVVSADYKSPYYSVPAWALSLEQEGWPGYWSRQRVYVSPMTVYRNAVSDKEIPSAWDISLIDHDLTRLNYKRAAALALEHGFRVSTQQHLWYELE